MANDNYDDLDALFSGGGAPAFKFEKIKDSITGTISFIETRQQRDFDSNEPKFWDDGKPMMEVIVTLDTTLRDKEIEDDDGSRRVFVRGAMLTAMRAAIKKVKEKKPEIGGRLTITHSGLGEAKKKGFNAPKLFEVTYEAPTGVATEALFAVDDDETTEVEDAALAKLKAMSPDELAAVLAGVK